ncbi:MAG: MFS transporter [Oliverpabstia sp.]
MSKEQKNTILGGLLMVFAFGLSNNVVAYYITPVTESLGYTRASFNFCFTLMSVVSFLVAPVYGYLFMKVSIRKIVFAGAMAGSICFFAYAMCRNIYAFYIVGILQGLVQSGTTNMSIVVLINRFFNERQSGTATGIIMSGTGICSMIMSAVLPPFIEQYGWSKGYMLCGILWAGVMLTAVWLLKEKPGTEAADEKKNDEMKGITYREALRCGGFYILILCVLICNIVMVCSQHLPAYFQDVGLSTRQAGHLMMIFSLGLIVWKIVLGELFDRLGSIPATIIAYISFIFGLWLLSLETILTMTAGVLIAALGIASSTVLSPLITRQVFGLKEYAPIWSLVSMATAFGVAVGSPIWGAFYDFSGSYHLAFAGAPFLLAAAMLLLVMLMKKKYYQAS